MGAAGARAPPMPLQARNFLNINEAARSKRISNSWHHGEVPASGRLGHDLSQHGRITLPTLESLGRSGPTVNYEDPHWDALLRVEEIGAISPGSTELSQHALGRCDLVHGSLSRGVHGHPSHWLIQCLSEWGSCKRAPRLGHHADDPRDPRRLHGMLLHERVVHIALLQQRH
eukprot:15464463-Alexandrium_andersonii.AAC.1